MKCPNCGSTMEKVGSALTRDKRELVTNFLCHGCLKRSLVNSPNPTFVPTTPQQQAELAKEAE